jgi:hydroxymethylglutaryl-CoA lyase
MEKEKRIKIIECPRDAMQGLPYFIETREKVEYLNALLKVGYDTIDFGSFVNPKAVPQMRDTRKVLERLDLSKTTSKLLAIVANKRGAEEAIQFNEIDYLGYPFSISEEFQKRNTGKGIDASLGLVHEIQALCHSANKKLVVYLSMAFGNPYGENWSTEIALKWSERLVQEIEVKIIALSDTVGTAIPEDIASLFSTLIPAFDEVEFGAHLHAQPTDWEPKVESAWKSGCLRFDGAINGWGGCPMAKNELVGNLDTNHLLGFSQKQGIYTGLNLQAFEEARTLASTIFH